MPTTTEKGRDGWDQQLSQPFGGCLLSPYHQLSELGPRNDPRNTLPQQLVQCSIASQHQRSINWLDDTLSQTIQVGTNTHRSTSDIGQSEDILDLQQLSLEAHLVATRVQVQWESMDTLLGGIIPVSG